MRLTHWCLALGLGGMAGCAMQDMLAPDLADAKGGPGDPIVVDTVLPNWPVILVGDSQQFCWFGGLKSGRFAMRTRDAARCGTLYRAAFDSTQRAVTKKEQATVDTVTVTWSATMDVTS